MSADFIAIKHLEGELKISHKKGDFGLSVTDREFVLQRPHLNIHVRLGDIVSIMPAGAAGNKPVRVTSRRGAGEEVVRSLSSLPHYRIHIREARMHNRSGIMTVYGLQLVIPVMDDLLSVMVAHSGGLTGI